MLIPVWALVYSSALRVSWRLLLVFVKLLDGIALLTFWIALGDMITGRQAKRLFAPLAAGITIGRLAGQLWDRARFENRGDRGFGSVCELGSTHLRQRPRFS